MNFSKLLSIRHEYADVYVSQFEEDLIIPWRPLTLKQFADYCRDLDRQFIPAAILENEVFRRCVVDKDIVASMDQLTAGIITTVVQNILNISGPIGVESFNSDVEQARAALTSGHDKFIHEAVYLIALAFPYKPEEIYAMDYPVMLQRLVLAEYKLLQTGVLREPISVTLEGHKSQPAFANLNPELQEEKKPRTKIDAKKLWEEQQSKQQGVRSEPIPKSEPQPVSEKVNVTKEKWWKESPVLEAQKKHSINFDADGEAASLFLLDTHERNEPQEMRDYILDQKLAGKRQQLIEDVDWIYPGLRDKVKRTK